MNIIPVEHAVNLAKYNELFLSTFILVHMSQYLFFFVQENLKAVEVAQNKELDCSVKTLGTLYYYAQLLCKICIPEECECSLCKLLASEESLCRLII